MLTVKVWVLLAAIGSSVVSIDNLPTEAECMRLGQEMTTKRLPEVVVRYRCYEVEKVQPNHPAQPS